MSAKQRSRSHFHSADGVHGGRATLPICYAAVAAAVNFPRPLVSAQRVIREANQLTESSNSGLMRIEAGSSQLVPDYCILQSLLNHSNAQKTSHGIRLIHFRWSHL